MYTDRRRCDERQAGDSSGALLWEVFISGKPAISPLHPALRIIVFRSREAHIPLHQLPLIVRYETRIIFKVARENELSTISQHNAQLQVPVVTLRAKNERFLNLFHNN